MVNKINVEDEKFKRELLSLKSDENKPKYHKDKGFIKTIATKVKISSIAEEHGIEKGRNSNNYLCPFHDDHRPSLSLNDDTGQFFCQGCKEKGNLINFLVKLDKISVEEAKNKLRVIAGIEDESEIIALKRIDVRPKQKIKTRILISDVSPGVSLIKNYIARCKFCGNEKEVYSKKIKKCDECGKSFVFEESTDTGYLCTAYDPLDSGGNPQFTNVFFSNKIIPNNKEEREEWETDIQTKKMIIIGEVVLLPTNKKVIEWLIDVKSFYFEKREVIIDYELLRKFGDIKRDRLFFEKEFAPNTYNKVLSKRVYCLTLLGSYKVKLPNGKIDYGVTSVMEAGDPGQNKTGLGKEILKYCKDGNSKIVSVENATMRGLIGSAVKNQSTGQWMIKIGQIPLTHQELCILDGFGKLRQDDSAQIRGIQEEKEFQIVKAGNITKLCVVRMIVLSNLIKNVAGYSTKHKASFDISATTGDFTNKFSGADRRRYAHILVTGDEDTRAEDIDEYLYKKFNPQRENELINYWNNLREYSWNLNEDDFIWEENILEYSKKKINELRKRYESFSLDYGILSKGGLKQLLIQLCSVAILHESINENYRVVIKKEHVDWLIELYYDEFRSLGLDTEIGEVEFYNKHIEMILKNSSNDLIESFKLLWKYGSYTSIEKSGIKSRSTMWRKFNETIGYTVQYEDEKKPTQCFYIPNRGSVRRIHEGDTYYFEDINDLPPICKKDGILTNFGRLLLKRVETYETRETHKIINSN